MPNHHLTVSRALTRLPGPNGERFVELFEHGTLSGELYPPRNLEPFRIDRAILQLQNRPKHYMV